MTHYNLLVSKITSVLLMCLLLLSPINLNAAYSHQTQQSQIQNKQEIVVLIHGLFRSSLSMYFLKAYLKHQGYEVYAYDYQSAKYPIKQHGEKLNHYIKDLIKKYPNAKIHFVTHSLGGIISREGLAQLNSEQLKHIGYLIMLAPPNHGSNVAKNVLKILPFSASMIGPLGELNSEDKAYIHQVPIPAVKIGIIVGAYDHTVPLKAAVLEGYPPPVIVRATHSFIMNNAQARKYIVRFLKTGAFS